MSAAPAWTIRLIQVDIGEKVMSIDVSLPRGQKSCAVLPCVHAEPRRYLYTTTGERDRLTPLLEAASTLSRLSRPYCRLHSDCTVASVCAAWN
jgi:hypothetical protein